MKNTKIQKKVQNFRIYIYPFNLYSLFFKFFHENMKKVYICMYIYITMIKKHTKWWNEKKV